MLIFFQLSLSLVAVSKPYSDPDLEKLNTEFYLFIQLQHPAEGQCKIFGLNDATSLVNKLLKQ